MAHAVGGFLLTVARQWMTNHDAVILQRCSGFITKGINYIILLMLINSWHHRWYFTHDNFV